MQHLALFRERPQVATHAASRHTPLRGAKEKAPKKRRCATVRNVKITKNTIKSPVLRRRLFLSGKAAWPLFLSAAKRRVVTCGHSLKKSSATPQAFLGTFSKKVQCYAAGFFGDFF